MYEVNPLSTIHCRVQFFTFLSVLWQRLVDLVNDPVYKFISWQSLLVINTSQRHVYEPSRTPAYSKHGIILCYHSSAQFLKHFCSSQSVNFVKHLGALRNSLRGLSYSDIVHFVNLVVVFSSRCSKTLISFDASLKRFQVYISRVRRILQKDYQRRRQRRGKK